MTFNARTDSTIIIHTYKQIMFISTITRLFSSSVVDLKLVRILFWGLYRPNLVHLLRETPWFHVLLQIYTPAKIKGPVKRSNAYKIIKSCMKSFKICY